MAKKTVKKVAKKTAPAKKATPKKATPKKVVAKKTASVKKAKVAAKKTVVKKSTKVVVKESSTPKVVTKKAKPENKKVSIIKKPIKKAKFDISKVRIPKTNTKEKVTYIPDFETSFLSEENTLHNMNNNVTPSVRYSDADLEEFKKVIVSKIDRSKAELTYLQNLIKDKEDIAQKAFVNADDGIAVQEHEQLVQMAGRQVEFIRKLDEALIRIENKTYGICRVTGKLIDKKRLLSVPHATLSMEAKNSRKNNDN